MKYTVKIEADHNDGDYVTEEHTVNQETLDELIKIIDVIKENAPKGGHNWDTWSTDENPESLYGHILSEEDIEWFQDWLPYVDNGTIHTITNISYSPQVNWTRLL